MVVVALAGRPVAGVLAAGAQVGRAVVQAALGPVALGQAARAVVVVVEGAEVQAPVDPPSPSLDAQRARARLRQRMAVVAGNRLLSLLANLSLGGLSEGEVGARYMGLSKL